MNPAHKAYVFKGILISKRFNGVLGSFQHHGSSVHHHVSLGFHEY